MTKFVTLLGRKHESAIEPQSPPMPPASTLTTVNSLPNEAGLDIDDELFFPIAAQLGQENETVRSLLKDAQHKIGELETIKLSIAKLVDPVSNTLRGYEETKSEKLILQRALKSAREATSKLRDELAAAEKKSGAFKAECTRLQGIVETAKHDIAALERSKAELLAELGVQRAHVAELQNVAQQQASDLRLARDENRRVSDRAAAADQRSVQLEGQAQAAQQEARQANHERAAIQASLDKALGELAQTARGLSDAEKALALMQARLNATEANLAEVQAERARLSVALDDAGHEHRDAMNLLSSRFEATHARLNLTESLLEDSRQALMARADEIRAFERRVIEGSTANDVLAEKLSSVEALLADRELQIKDLELAHAALTEQAQKLVQVATARAGAYDNAQQRIREQNDLVEVLQEQLNAARSSNEVQTESFNAQLQREQLERSMAEGALATARKDIARLQHEIAALHGRSMAHGPDQAPVTPDVLKRAA